MSFVRNSKFRHVFGQPWKREQCLDGIRVTKCAWDGTFCAINNKWIAVVSDACAGGSFLVVPQTQSGRVDADAPVVAGHKHPVLEIQWCPHNENVIASASEDGHVMIWIIPSEGLTESITDPAVDLFGHQKRVGIIAWHPTAANVILSAGQDNKLIVWDISTAKALVALDLDTYVISAAWNYDGSKLAFTSKDKMLRVMDVRKGEILQEVQAHEGYKPSLCIWLQDWILTTGFSRMSKRSYAVWDSTNLGKAITTDEVDSSNGIIFPYFDRDSGLLFLVGKGDSQIRYYEVTDDAPYVHFISAFMSNEPQRGIGYMPKRGVDVNLNEVVRLYKLHARGYLEVIPFICPRKSELFQTDLYPPAISGEPSMTVDEWFSGKNADPILVDLAVNFSNSVPSQTSGATKVFSVAAKKPTAAAAAPAPAPVVQAQPVKPKAEPVQQQREQEQPVVIPAKAKPESVRNNAHPPTESAHVNNVITANQIPPEDDMRALVASLSARVDQQDARIAELEAKLSSLEVV